MSALHEAAAGLLAAAKRAGADVAEVVLHESASVSVQRRLGKTEETERAETREIGLRVFLGRANASVSASAIDPASFIRLAEQAVSMARVVPADPYAEIPEAPAARDAAFLDLDDPVEPDMAALIARAAAAEDAALAVPGITNSEGASASWSRGTTLLATSRGFIGGYARSHHGVSVTAIAGEGTGMQRDYDYSSTLHGADLEDPATLGHRAAQRALARLNPRRPQTAKLPVVFDPRVAGGLLGHLAGAISGAAIARGTSFLKEALGQAVFAPGVSIIDDPFRVRGLRSRPYDREGQTVQRRAFIEDGVLTSWILDTRSANQLGLKTTGNAGGLSNFYLAPGAVSPAALMADIAEGLYVTELIGMGVNGLTGDYSRGAAGFMIRKGQLAEPVAECTIAGNLKDMFRQLTPADDLVFKRGTDAPTLRVEAMTLAGA
ncbi:TldD/PmbA family protein [Acidocella sp. KAb 2-4]|uniref:TldD/PmbA family protein n=1 Tax=Acidocella sp. KAb 2-4 TaxID=2885158 RepID=UPI001D091766|nr:metallopeptidase TldD-related protein [Acidocella sp. KAb 2-4]MCB5944208.1 TldD/PmbA family protein [Acidocella sp. KAb 2-4]